MRRLALIVAALAAALVAGVAQANDARIDRLSTVFAMRPSRIECRTPDQDATLGDAWGYTQLNWAYAVVQQELCDQLVALLDGQPYDDFLAAEAVATITHESYHVRRWAWRANEGHVQCQEIRHWKVALRILGVDEQTIGRLWPWALYDHYRTIAIPDYNLPGCKVPAPWG